MVLGQFKAVPVVFLVELGQYKAFMPLYNDKNGDLVGFYRSLTL